MIYYQGESISVSLELYTEGGTTSWDNISEVVLYFYTNTSHMVKFKNDGASGYGTLTLIGDIYSCRISSEETKHMEGALYMDMMLVDTTGAVKQIEHVTTGIDIRYTPIKQEV